LRSSFAIDGALSRIESLGLLSETGISPHYR